MNLSDIQAPVDEDLMVSITNLCAVGDGAKGLLVAVMALAAAPERNG